MQICCICVLPFLILAIAKGFLLRLIKERVDPYKDWGPFLISCGIYQTCQSLEKGSLSRRSLIGLLITSIKPEKCLQIPIVSMPRPMIWLFFPFYWISYHHHISTPCIFLFLGAPLGYENIPRKWREKSVNIKSPFHRKVSSCVKEGLFSSIQNWIRQKRQRGLFAYRSKTPTWKPIEQKSCSVNDKSAL